MRPSQKQITPEQLAFAQAHALVRIVDDEADLREALSFVLDMEGWKTVTYGRAEDFFTGDSVGAGLRGARRAHAGHERD